MTPRAVPGRRRARRTPPTRGRSTLEPLPAPAPVDRARASSRCSTRSAIGEVPISVSGRPTPRGPLVHTVRAVGAVTARDLRVASPARCSASAGPFGNALAGRRRRRAATSSSSPAGSASRRSARSCCARARAPRRATATCALLYGARTPARPALPRASSSDWRARRSSVDVTVDAPAPDWHGKVGVVPKLVAGAALRPERDDRVRLRARRS